MGFDYVRIGKLDENDFDAIVRSAGGRRVSADHSREERLNADYALGEAAVELKLVEQEGLDKEERQKKVSEVFRAQQPDRPVVILKPELLDAAGQRAYYSAMAGPIKGHVRKAAKQLQETATKMGGDPIRVLLLINNGYGALSHEEFKDIAFKRACNDTQHIDSVVVGGFYYYSDTFEHYALEPLELCPINADRPFQSFEALRREWGAFVNRFMTDVVCGRDERISKRLPVVDLRYEIDGITYVKPAPLMGKPSKFFRNGRPRRNSTGITITSIPPVATTFPDMDEANWRRFKERLPESWYFKESFAQWRDFKHEEDRKLSKDKLPFVPVAVDFGACITWCDEQNLPLDVPVLCAYAVRLFHQAVCELIDRACDKNKTKIVLTEYISLVTEEIGQDKADDLSSIYHVHEGTSGSRERTLLKDGRLFFEQALALACAYAVKLRVDSVMYEKDLTHAWV